MLSLSSIEGKRLLILPRVNRRRDEGVSGVLGFDIGWLELVGG